MLFPFLRDALSIRLSIRRPPGLLYIYARLSIGGDSSTGNLLAISSGDLIRMASFNERSLPFKKRKVLGAGFGDSAAAVKTVCSFLRGVCV